MIKIEVFSCDVAELDKHVDDFFKGRPYVDIISTNLVLESPSEEEQNPVVIYTVMYRV